MTNSTSVMHFATAMVLVTTMLGVASGQEAKSVGPMFAVPDFRNVDYKQARQGFAAVDKSFADVVDNLRAQMTDPNVAPMARGYAACALGNLRAKRAAVEMIKLIDFQVVWAGPKGVPARWAQYPFEEALERMDGPAFSAALEACEIEDQPARRKLLVTVLCRAEHARAAKLVLTAVLNHDATRLKDVEIRHLKACIDQIDNAPELNLPASVPVMTEIASTQPITAKLEPFEVPDFRGMTYEQADQGIRLIDSAFGQVVNNLMAQVEDQSATPMGRGCAAHVVGTLRAASAVPRLMKMIDYHAGWIGPHDASEPWHSWYPCKSALEQMGTPALDAALAACSAEDDLTRRKLLVGLLIPVAGGGPYARSVLSEMMDGSKDDAQKRRLQSCIEMFDNPALRNLQVVTRGE